MRAGTGTRRALRLAAAALGVASLLAALPGAPQVSAGPVPRAAAAVAGFTDVADDALYAPAVEWAAEEGVLRGYRGSTTTFAPAATVTRRQLLVALWRMMDRPAVPEASDLVDLPDNETVRRAAAWAEARGVIRGTSLDGGSDVDRRLLATWMWRTAGRQRRTPDHTYTDVPARDVVVRWMAAHGFDAGAKDASFRPAAVVTRAMLAQLLHSLAGRPEAWDLPAPRTALFRCELLDQRSCLLPFPSNALTVPDPSTDTGRRLAIRRSSAPANAGGVRIATDEINRNDGFSPGAPIMTFVPGIDAEQTGIADVTDIGASLDDDAPIVLIDAATGERHPYWAELDSQATVARDRVLFVRPAENLAEGHRYLVALRDMRRGDGSVIEPGDVFRAYRDGEPTHVPVIEGRRSRMEGILDRLDDLGIAREDLYLAWDFTVASERNLTERVLHIRDDALADLDGAPAFTVASDVANGDGTRRIKGTFTVPNYLTGAGGAGSSFNWVDGLPAQSATNPTVTPNFECTVPSTATAEDPARIALYGHGLLGSAGEIGAGNLRAFAMEHNIVLCATDWWGMSNGDFLNVVGLLQDLSTFHTLADRAQQGFLNFIFLGKLLLESDGFASSPTFQGTGDASILDSTELFYDGNSQGGIMGGALVAVSPDIERAVLGVPGMNYSTLLQRSVDWDQYAAIFNPSYPVELERPIALALAQTLWDRAEANGYAHHMTDDPLPGSPAKAVLLHVAWADWQVANVTADVEARTIGARIHAPALADGKSIDVEPFWGIPEIESYPYEGSAIVYWDSGNPAPPPTNRAPDDEVGDPHGKPRAQVSARAQKSAFLQPGGVVIDACGGLPCLAP